MDRIIALYKLPSWAERVRDRLGSQGIPTDRLDVVSLTDHGRVGHLRDQSFDEDLAVYFHVLLRTESEWPLVDEIVEAIQNGKAALVFHPRGQEEIDMARRVIDAHTPEKAYWRIASDEALGGLPGEQSHGVKP